MPDRKKPYPTDPLSEADNAHLREMWEFHERRRWLQERMNAIWKWVLGVPPFIISLYVLWQTWKGSK
jgi:hypothetical protein